MQLLEDVNSLEAMLKDDDTELLRRAYVRSLFMLLEADLHGLRETLADRIVERSALSGKWNFHLLTLLMDEKPSINQRGKPSLSRRQRNFTNFSKFLLRVYAQLAGASEEIFKDEGWSDFQKLINLRNRLTHPKTINDISVTDADLKISYDARDWYLEILEQIERADRENSRQIPTEIDDIEIPFFEELTTKISS